jgi:hypothetical protein
MVEIKAPRTMTKWMMIGLLICLTSAASYAQTNEEGKVIIKYDPLFWKDQLKLSPSQSDKIKEINIEYYEKIKVVSTNQAQGYNNNTRMRVDQFLEQRSNQIWNTFHTRQKRKWVKMWNDSKNG